MIARQGMRGSVIALTIAVVSAAAAVGQEPVVLAPAMLDVLAPQTNEVVGVLIDSFGVEEKPDPAKLSEEDWAAMEDAVAVLHAQTAQLRDRPIQVVADPDATIFGEESSGISAADVQTMIEEDRATFDYYVDLMLADFDRMSDAIEARDAAALWDVAGVLDVKCNACHERFWYANWQEDVLTPP